MISRRLFLGSVAALAAGHAFAEAPLTSPLPKPKPIRGKASAGDASALIKAADLGGKVSYVVADAATGEILESVAPSVAMAPASVVKIMTALFALDTLGPGYRFKTRLIQSGDGLILQGGGDPMLTTDHLAELAKRARGAGVKGAGSFAYDASALPYLHEIDPNQAIHLNYNPSISGLNLNFNQVYFEWKKAGGDWQVSMDARTDKLRPRVDMARMSVANRDVPVYTYAESPGEEVWTVARGALGNGGSRWLPVRQPGLYCGEVFRTLAKAEGIDLPDPRAGKVTGGKVVAEVLSAPLSEIVDQMLRYSINIVAEVIGLTASHAQSLGASAEIMRRGLGAYGLRSAVFGDHSGLSPETRVTARETAELLIDAKDTALKSLMKSVSMKNSKGKVVKDHPVSVRAKSGTLNFVSNLAGYADVPGGRTLAFAIYAGDLDRREAANATGDDVPAGVRTWTKRAHQLQNDLIDRWGKLYSA